MSKNISQLSARKGLDDNLFENYVRLAAETGTPPREDLQRLAKDFLLGEAVTVGAASFYDFLKTENLGKKIYVCSGTGCETSGTQSPLRRKLRERFDESEIGEMCCLGRCHEGGAFHFQGRNYSGNDLDNIDAILDGKLQQSAESLAIASTLDPPLLTAPFPGLDEYYSPFPNLAKRPPEDLLAEIETSELRGRGGAGFPVGLKWKSCRASAGQIKYIVCNADEGDPGAYSDRYLLEQRPHSVLFGMLVAGAIVGAETGVLYIRAEYPESYRAIQNAIAELAKAGWTGADIHGTGLTFNFKVIQAAGAYVCGEETALLASIEGQRPEVRVRPPYPTQEGLFGKPTVINNVETFACIHTLFHHGAETFAKIGTAKSTGPKLVSLDSLFNAPGVYEVPMGAPLSHILRELGKGFRKPVKAIQIGGPLGGVIPASIWDELTLDFESLSDHGFLLGHGSIISIPEDYAMIDYVSHLFQFTAAESCGKCAPCRFGAVRGKELVDRARNENEPIDRELFDDLLETLELTSLCGLGSGLPIPVRNILQHFEDELKPYFA